MWHRLFIDSLSEETPSEQVPGRAEGQDRKTTWLNVFRGWEESSETGTDFVCLKSSKSSVWLEWKEGGGVGQVVDPGK